VFPPGPNNNALELLARHRLTRRGGACQVESTVTYEAKRLKLLLASGKPGTIVFASATGRADQLEKDGSTGLTRASVPLGESSTRVAMVPLPSTRLAPVSGSPSFHQGPSAEHFPPKRRPPPGMSPRRWQPPPQHEDGVVALRRPRSFALSGARGCGRCPGDQTGRTKGRGRVVGVVRGSGRPMVLGSLLLTRGLGASGEYTGGA
jgi:hypothetical protein